MRTLLEKQVDTTLRLVSGGLGRELVLGKARFRLQLLVTDEVLEAGETLDYGIFILVKSFD